MQHTTDHRRTLLREIATRVRFYERPPKDFDPRTAPPDALAKYGIPARPSRHELPLLAEFWDEMFSPPLTFTEASYALAADPVRISDQLLMTASAGREASLNWSGAYITPRNGRRFTEVHGSWVVPDVNPPAGMPSSQEFRSSIWIGLDGQRRYFDSSLPQLGTAQFVNAPNDPPFSVWWQWWLRDNPTTYIPVILPLPVQRGHRMMASLLVLSETQVHFVIENRTTGEMFPPFAVVAPFDASSAIQPKVSGATAEWVVERPSHETSGELYELPDYNSVQFTRCFAISAHALSGPHPGGGLEQTLEGARLINMYKVERNPSRTVVISKAKRLPSIEDGVETAFSG